MFCAPYNASDILVIDSVTEETRLISCGVEGESKWVAIACCGTKLFCAPFHPNDIFVLEDVYESLKRGQNKSTGSLVKLTRVKTTSSSRPTKRHTKGQHN